MKVIERRAFNRRGFLIGAGALSGLAFTRGLPSHAQTQAPKFRSDPFSLGVASGDPLPDGVVLWTRLAPDPLNGGGMPPGAVTVKWEIAADEQWLTKTSTWSFTSAITSMRDRP